MLPPAPFTPTVAQRRLVNYVVLHPSFETVPELCLAAGVDPTSYYRWSRDPDFRRWFTREWSSALLFEAWHVLNIARANMSRSSTHFRALFSLLFEPKGQLALDAWQEHATAAALASPSQPASDVPSNQELGPENASILEFAPAQVARHLQAAVHLAAAAPQASPPLLR